jgi:hypothetical protein
MDSIRKLLFPAAIALNMYQPTILLIVLGFFGNGGLAADLGISQGAVVAVFMAFSGNARSLILADSSGRKIGQILTLRLLLILPLAAVTFYLSRSIVEVPLWLVLTLIIRRVGEWIAEVQLTKWEMEAQISSVVRFIILQGFGLMPFLAVLVADTPELFRGMLIVWAVMPLMMAWQLLSLPFRQGASIPYQDLLPHFGSSSIVSISMYVFRIMVTLIAGKELAGILFSAFSLGGMISAFYAFALGPSLIKHGGGEGKVRTISSTMILLGAAWILIPLHIECSAITHILHLAIGVSLLGGALMIRAQHLRLLMIQRDGHDVFVQDCFANILLIASIPFASSLFGPSVLLLLFLWSSILNLAFYMIPVTTSSNAEQIAQTP